MIMFIESVIRDKKVCLLEVGLAKWLFSSALTETESCQHQPFKNFKPPRPSCLPALTCSHVLLQIGSLDCQYSALIKNKLAANAAAGASTLDVCDAAVLMRLYNSVGRLPRVRDALNRAKQTCPSCGSTASQRNVPTSADRVRKASDPSTPTARTLQRDAIPTVPSHCCG